MKRKKKVDRSSRYYRVCKECNMEFLANHMTREFCTDKCADDYHNQLKSNLNKAFEILNLKSNFEKLNKARIAEIEKQNIAKLEVFEINHITGSVFSEEELINGGLNFNGISKKIIAGHNDDGVEQSILIIGKYVLFHKTDRNIVIIK